MGHETDAAAQRTPAISFRDASFAYEGAPDGAFAFSHLNLDIEPGSFVCIVGENGSGKSTLARHIDALLIPTAGEVLVEGRSTRDAAQTTRIRTTVGLVFQNPDDQLVASIVEDDVAFGPENLGIAPDEIARRITRALSLVGLAGYEKREVHTLSGGQKQRLAIAGALACEPRILVLDEPTAMLDPRGRLMVTDVIERVRQSGTTVVLITHFMEEAARADRVVALHRGAICLDGTPAEVLTRTQELEAIGLEPPLACRLGTTLHAQGIEIGGIVDDDALVEQLSALHERARHAAEQAPASASDAPGASSGAATPYAASAPQQLSSSGASASDAPAAHGAADAVIALERIGFTYDDARTRKKTPGRVTWALRSVSLALRRGEVLGIAGHTGSGKSTLIRHLNGLLAPVEGRVLLDGADLAEKGVAARARHTVGVVFQYPETQLFAATVYDDVAFGPRNQALAPEEVDARVRSALGAVRLPFDEVAGASPFALSGGQQRRVAIAGVLACEPAVLVLDEPAAGLDPASRTRLITLIDELHRARNLTVVVVSHAMDDLAQLADRILVLDDGRVHALDTPAAVFTDAAALERIGLSAPAPQLLATRLRACGFTLPRALYTEETLAADIADELSRAMR